MENVNYAAHLIGADWAGLMSVYGVIFAFFGCIIVMFGWMIADEVMTDVFGFGNEIWEEEVVSLPVLAPGRVFYRTVNEYVAFTEELAFWPGINNERTDFGIFGCIIEDAVIDFDKEVSNSINVLRVKAVAYREN